VNYFILFSVKSSQKGDYQMQRLRIKPARRPNPLKRLFVLLVPILIVAAAGFFVFNNIILPANKYKTAMSYLSSGQFDEAKILFAELGDYKDSAEKYALFTLMHPAIGDVILFGHYEQDDNAENGPEAVAWRVIASENGQGLLLAEKNLDCQPFNSNWTETAWDKSTLRQWLNSDFIDVVFTADQQQALVLADLVTPGNAELGIATNQTSDRVFILSKEEAEDYFSSAEDRIAENTPYAIVRGAQSSTGGFGNWWLRSSGSSATRAAEVYSDGSIVEHGFYVDYDGIAVRPVIWVDLISENYLSTAKPR
jgi:hypothetical protein